MIVLGMVYETKEIGQVLSYLSNLIHDAVNSDNWAASYSIYFLAQLLFHLLWVPGLTFWNALIGYYMDNVWVAFAVVYIPAVISCFITYFVAKYIFKAWCLNRFLTHKVFKAFFQESKEKPWKTSIFFRMMFVPVATKNYMMPLLNINFVQYAIPAAIFYIPYLGAMVFVGANLDNIIKVAEGNGWSDMNGYEKFQYIFTMALGVGTVLILAWFAYLTWKKMKEINKQEEEQKAAENSGDAENGYNQKLATSENVPTNDEIN